MAGDTAEEMIVAAERHAGERGGAKLVRQRLTLARHHEPEDFERQMGWVLTAFQNAFHHLVRSTPVADAVSVTVSRGADTDTNAAICGAVLGARHPQNGRSVHQILTAFCMRSSVASGYPFLLTEMNSQFSSVLSFVTRTDFRFTSRAIREMGTAQRSVGLSAAWLREPSLPLFWRSEAVGAGSRHE